MLNPKMRERDILSTDERKCIPWSDEDKSVSAELLLILGSKIFIMKFKDVTCIKIVNYNNKARSFPFLLSALSSSDF